MISLKAFIIERMGDSISAFSDIFKRMIKNLSPHFRVKLINEYVILLKIDSPVIDMNTGEMKDDVGRQMESFLNFLNYHYVGIEDKNDNYAIVKYEANKPKQIRYHGEYLYHYTTSFHVDSIIENGLCPKDATKFGNHEHRVYCWGEKANKELVKSYCDANFRAKCEYYRRKNPEWFEKQICTPVVLRIDYKQMIKDGKNITLYSDPMTAGDNAMFTTDNIDPKYLGTDKTWLT